MNSRSIGRIAQFAGTLVAWRFAGTHPTQEQAVLFILLSVLGIVFGLTMRAVDVGQVGRNSDNPNAPRN